MGFGKFMLKHGAVGSIAKDVAKSYMQLKKQHPKTDKTKLMRRVLEQRAASNGVKWLEPPTKKNLDDISTRSGNYLKRLAEEIIMMEIHTFGRIAFESPQIIFQAFAVIGEVVERIAPGE